MEKKVEFKVGDDILRGSLFTPVGQGPFPGVVFFHGRGSSRGRYLEISKRLAEKGFMALAFDFRGCGESDGNFPDQTQRMGIDDARAGLEFLLSQNVDKNRIGVMGTSFGGFVTAIIVPEFEFIKSIVLRVPAIFPEELANDHILSWSKEGDLVYDPMIGSGTVAKIALLYKRNFIGSEISKEYCEEANKRIKPLLH